MRPQFRNITMTVLLECFILFSSLNFSIFSQPNTFRFDNISSEDGLFSNDVKCILQDYKGFLWIGTSDGLNRYDGKTFKKYTHSKTDSTSISSNWINVIYEDRDSNLWIGTSYGGLNLFNRKTGQFLCWKNNPSDPQSISKNDVKSIFEDSEGNLWLGTYGLGLNLFDRKNGTFRRWLHDPNNPNSISHNSINTITEDSKGRLLIGTEGGGISIFDYETNTFVKCEEICEAVNNYPSLFISHLFKDSKDQIWIGSDNGLTKINPITREYHHWGTSFSGKNELSSNFVTKIIEDKSGNLWIGTRDAGLNYFNTNTETFTSSKFSNNKYSLCDNEIVTLFVDNSNILWIGTHGGGISKLRLNNLAFQYWNEDPLIKDGLPQKEVRKLFHDKDDIVWVGTNNGLSKFDRKTNIFTTYNLSPEGSSGPKGNRVRSIHKSRKGVLYVGYEKGGLNEFDEKNNKFISYLPKAGNTEDISSRNLRAICEDSKGILWLGTYNEGLHSFDPKTKELKKTLIYSKDSLILQSERIEIIINNNDDELWVGTGNGLVLYNTKTLESKIWSSNDENNSSILHNAIRSLYKQNDSVLWIGTRGGLSRFDLKEEKFTNFTTKDGLPSNVIYGILPISKSGLWLMTTNGLSKFNYNTLLFKNTPVPYNNELEVGIYSLSNKKEMILGGKNGLTIFNTDKNKENTIKPNVVFTDFRKHNLPIKMDVDYAEVKSLKLNYNDNMFSVSFAALDFTNPLENRYSYKLEGFNDEWIDLDNTNTVTFTNLDPGKFKLIVIASNNDKIWNPNPTVLDIYIQPPLWKTFYFRLFAILLIVLFVYWGIKLKKAQSIKKQNAKLDKLIKLRTSELEAEIKERKKIETRLKFTNASKDKFFSILSHDLRSPFTAITGLTEVLISEFPSFSKEELKDNLATVNRSAKRVYTLLENLLDWSSVQTGRIIFTPKHFCLNSIVKEVIALFEVNLESKNLKIIFDSSKSYMAFADYDMIYTVIRNLVSNAIKFTHDNGKIKILINRENENIAVSVKDNGIGIDKDFLDKLYRIDVQQSSVGTKAEKGTGLGLILCKELVKINNGKIWIESERGKGTTIKFTLPIS